MPHLLESVCVSPALVGLSAGNINEFLARRVKISHIKFRRNLNSANTHIDFNEFPLVIFGIVKGRLRHSYTKNERTYMTILEVFIL